MSEELKDLVKASNNFNNNILQKLLAMDKEKNISISGFGIFTFLTLFRQVSTSETEQELNKFLKIDKITKNELNTLFKNLMDQLQVSEELKEGILKVSNSFWAPNMSEITKEFQETAQAYFQTDMKTIETVEQGRRDLSKWVKEKSFGLIQDIRSDEIITDDIADVLCNILYFKDFWVRKFVSKYTKPREFTLLNNEKILVPMMVTNVPGFWFGCNFEQTIIFDLEYVDRKVMRIILPDKGNTLENALRSYNNADIIPIEPAFFEISVPKFSFKKEIDFIPLLKSLGLKELFKRNNTDLNISISKENVFNKMKQISLIENNEVGTEAGAFSYVNRIIGGVTFSFVDCTRPFIFLLIDKETDLIFFSGIVLNPLES